MARPPKRLTEKEKEFALSYIEGKEKWTDIARRVFNLRCEPGSMEARRVQGLIRSVAFKDYVAELESRLKTEEEVKGLLDNEAFDWENLRVFAYKSLKNIRDNTSINSNTRFRAIQALEKLADPSQDHNLIYQWLYLLWSYAKAHCPACHASFPLAEVNQPELEAWRTKYELDPLVPKNDDFERRLAILKKADLRTEPHPGQKIALSAPERHIIVTGAARGGKSKALGMIALLYYLIPGTESWILARVYDDARSEMEYLDAYLNTLFGGIKNRIMKKESDSKTGEVTLLSKWGAEFKVKSAKAKGSITAREVDAILAAEPGWLPDDIYEEVRARLSSRLGRIFAFGTPKGMGGFIGRVVNMTGRDPKTNKILRLTADKRTIAAGMPWVSSLLAYTMDPSDNPAYVKAELAAARMELTDAEYAAEFEGKMVAQEGSHFHQITPDHLRIITPDEIQKSVFVAGIDQGERNFGCVVVAWDWDTAYITSEFFDNSDNTIKRNIDQLREHIPYWIRKIGGNPHNWGLTIFDQDPPVWNILSELEEEGRKWPTDITYRHRNQLKKGDNWRVETTDFINELARNKKLVFDVRFADLLHDQLLRVLTAPYNDKTEATSNRKGWIVQDAWRGDHVLDAFMLAMYTVMTNALVEVPNKPMNFSAYELAQKKMDYEMRKSEGRELYGYAENFKPKGDSELYEEIFQRKIPAGAYSHGWYQDES